MVRYETVVEDETVYVATDEDRLEIGELATIVELVGGRAWTIEYSDREKQAHPELNTADEGLTVDVVDTINAMTFGEAFVETLAAQPGASTARHGGEGDAADGGGAIDDQADGDDDIGYEEGGWGDTDDEASGGDPTGDEARGGNDIDDEADGVSPRLGLFVGRLLENLEYGLR
ncbi:hypothetical protein L593_08295 [Salinarchaeum sp. Harcht-Bsk1]|uniref:hypothetical protein n=1 Tax=Salinarchaeum sp. Harcht-Bsk1 TaxID=1333523 RepID=UPI0003422FB3|nr:hypothetical protein [Salinarchaeum sp. Harcht-Bsk1]AGN01604.1 hypothetical protein L593_08295 [Salinarchaeum sp. Harcht-Bsk1]